ncbi:MAG: TonB-dependent receptor, partial [Halioglobus sp.]|nr:TonB-dependent receptor [Halioglobus sp.]
ILKFNTSYQFSDGVMAYATVSEGYRNGVANSVPECTPEELAGAQPLCAKPDEVLVASDTTVNYELGLRTEGDNHILNAAIYYIEWDDIRVDGVTEFGGLPIFVNGSEARSQGIELSGQLQVTDKLLVEGTYAYNDAELRETASGIIEGEFIEATALADNVDGLKGDRLPGTPEHQVYLSSTYTCGLDGGSNLDFNWNMTAQSDVLTKVGNRASGEELDGFAIHNVSLTWSNEDVSVALYGDNVFDKYYETGVRRDSSYIADVGLFDLRRYYTNVGRPRQVGVRFNYNF